MIRAGAMVLLLAGCAHGPAPSSGPSHPAGELHTDGGLLRVESQVDDEEAEAQTRAALKEAGDRLGRLAVLPRPVTVRLLADHEALEALTGRDDQRWLRAWGRYDEVLLQSPRTWGPRGADARELTELLVHELSHCLLYQLSATRRDWRTRAIPFWFREGLASVMAEQAARWGGASKLRSFGPELLRRATSDEGPGDATPQSYAVAHHAFGLLLRRYGDRQVGGIVDAMHGGASFDTAFEAALGVTPKTFREDFLRWACWAA